MEREKYCTGADAFKSDENKRYRSCRPPWLDEPSGNLFASVLKHSVRMLVEFSSELWYTVKHEYWHGGVAGSVGYQSERVSIGAESLLELTERYNSAIDVYGNMDAGKSKRM